MKLKIKYFRGGEADEWTSAETHILRRWDAVLLIWAGVTGLSFLMAHCSGSVSLSEGTPGGFVLWFLVCCSYPLQGLLGIFCWIFGCSGSLYRVIEAHPAGMLTVLDLATVLAVWAAGRLAGRCREAVPRLKIAGNFVLILICWGVFQMLLFGIASVHQRGESARSGVSRQEPSIR